MLDPFGNKDRELLIFTGYMTAIVAAIYLAKLLFT